VRTSRGTPFERRVRDLVTPARSPGGVSKARELPVF